MASTKVAYYRSFILMIISLKHSGKCQIFLAFILRWFVEYNLFVLKKKFNFECQMDSVGTWSHNGDFSPECENGQYPRALKYKGIRCCV